MIIKVGAYYVLDLMLGVMIPGRNLGQQPSSAPSVKELITFLARPPMYVAIDKGSTLPIPSLLIRTTGEKHSNCHNKRHMGCRIVVGCSSTLVPNTDTALISARCGLP